MAIGETDANDPTAKSTVMCPSCSDKQTITAAKVLSVTQDQDETRLRAQ
jgi:hypothetical protein